MAEDDAAIQTDAAVAIAAAAPTVKSKVYRNQAIKLLQNEFRGLSCHAIKLVLEYHAFDFTDSYNVLSTIRADNLAAAEGIPAFQNQPKKLKIFIKTARKRKDGAVTDAGLREEVDMVPALNRKQSAADLAEVIDLVSDDDDSTGGDTKKEIEVECGCCYGDYPLSDMDECSAKKGHRCCKGCVERYVTEQLDGNNNTNFCCIIDSDCKGIYTVSQLDKLLPSKLVRRINDSSFRSGVEEAARSSGLCAWICDKCSHVGFLEEPLHPTVFCPGCNGTEYCRLCNNPAHPNMTCQQFQAEKDRLKDPVLRAHEAMSRATIRLCPQCQTPFQKHDGCNKMTCARCTCKSCYLCRSRINGYDHFCDKMNCRCNRCHLWANPAEADRHARRAAGRRALEGASMSAEEIEKILCSGSPPRRDQEGRRAQQARAQVPRAQPVQQQQAAAARPAVYQPPRVDLGRLQRLQQQVEQQRQQAEQQRLQREQQRRQREQQLEQQRLQLEQQRRQLEQRFEQQRRQREQQLEQQRLQREQQRRQREQQLEQQRLQLEQQRRQLEQRFEQQRRQREQQLEQQRRQREQQLEQQRLQLEQQRRQLEQRFEQQRRQREQQRQQQMQALIQREQQLQAEQARRQNQQRADQRALEAAVVRGRRHAEAPVQRVQDDAAQNPHAADNRRQMAAA
eukprot:CAMPEP_0178730534 /NCGR_PEP_ID=MMETSP0699-20121125/29573_1 /TAXON_ID=265572 /ORGANISM="Extubocellulus spinifer, Strain CCMP396" /LENGTH=676 /DNA_ID=CAMNT_0020382571 /DNA_START=306 /DNA_END=2332 /DNA_ORIENTATION=-